MNKYIEILNVKNIELSFNSLSLDNIKLLSEALKENKILTSLKLSYTYIGEEGAKYIAEALKENKTLTDLYLKGNNIGEGAKYICDALKENTTLTTLYLDLEWNKIGKKIEITTLICINKKYKLFMREQYKLLQDEIIEISLVPPDENNIPVLRNGGFIYREISEKYK